MDLRDEHVETIQSEANKYGDLKAEIIQQRLRQNEQSLEITNPRDHTEKENRVLRQTS